LEAWSYPHLCGYKTVNHSAGEYASDEDGGGFCGVHSNTLEGFWSLLRSWLRPYLWHLTSQVAAVPELF